MSKQFKELFDEKGIDQKLITPITPQQNSVIERRNRNLIEFVRSMMIQLQLPISF